MMNGAGYAKLNARLSDWLAPLVAIVALGRNGKELPNDCVIVKTNTIQINEHNKDGTPTSRRSPWACWRACRKGRVQGAARNGQQGGESKVGEVARETGGQSERRVNDNSNHDTTGGDEVCQGLGL